MVSLIWSCCSSEKHEDIVRATYELVTNLAKCLPAAGLQSLFSRVQTIVLPHIDGKTVLFLRDYSINAIENLKEAKRSKELQRPGTGKGAHQGSSSSQGQGSAGGLTQMFSRGGSSHGKKTTIISSLGGGQGSNRGQAQQAEVNEDDKYFNLMIFWNIATDTSIGASQRTKELALASLVEVLKLGHTYKSNIRDQFVQLALDRICELRSYAEDAVYIAIGFL
jgi:hypothetical protein